MKGYVHSFQSMGAVDGPGLRFVVFLQGCPLRCIYCHNPDTWEISGSEGYSPEEVAERIRRFKPYFGSDGGVTVSGGEPLLQWRFVSELFSLLKKEGIHTALDTCGIGDLQGAGEVLKVTDLVLCDIKFPDENRYRSGCGGSLEEVQGFLKLAETMGVPIWVRHVVIPNLTDSEEEIKKVITIAKSYSTLEKIELLPFKKLCISKYDALGITYPLRDTPECDDRTIAKLGEFIPKSLKT